MKKTFVIISILILLSFACGLVDDLAPQSEMEDIAQIDADLQAEENQHPTPTPLPLPDASAGTNTKWALWSNGTRLRGADLHPCNTADHKICTVPIMKQDIQELRDLGANLINASYPGVFSVEPPYEVDTYALAHLDNLIMWAEEVGIYVVIHYRTGPGRNESAIHLNDDAIYAVWTEPAAHDGWVDMWRFTAERYAGNPVVAGYDLMVEPHANTVADPDYNMEPGDLQESVSGTLLDWNALAQETTAAIRSVDAETPIIVSSLSWGAPEWFAALEPSGDPYTVYSLHAYEPTEYTHQEEDDISYSYPDTVKDGFFNSIEFNSDWLVAYLQPAVDFALANNVPIYVGEFGPMRWVPNAEVFLHDEVNLFEQYGWNYAYYVWRGDEEYFDGFNLEYGPDPANHTADLNNPVFSVFRERWEQNIDYPNDPPQPDDNQLPSAVSGDWWQPDVGTTWQWQLDQPIDQSIDVAMYDVDLFDTDASIVADLHAKGRIAICYTSVGSWEDWRPDAGLFPPSVLGNDYEGWPGEKWLDIRQIDLLAPIMRARLDECRAKGFDGIEPDNIDAYTNDTGFALSYADQLAYNIWLAEEAHQRGLSIGLKNDPDQVIDLLPHFDWALTEDCFDEGWCEQMLPFIAAGKPVFATEYTDSGMTTDQFCPQATSWEISAILKNRELGAFLESCQKT